jgi:hypothetical protein
LIALFGNTAPDIIFPQVDIENEFRRLFQRIQKTSGDFGGRRA